jgi:hypothetical protein
MIDPVDALFAEYPPGIQEICRALRAMVLEQLVRDAWDEGVARVKSGG